MYNFGFDIDEVVNLLVNTVLNHVKSKYTIDLTFDDITHYNFGEVPKLKNHKNIVHDIIDNFNRMTFGAVCLPDIDSVNVIRELYDKGNALHFISNRPLGMENITKDWFIKHDIPYSSITHLGFGKDKGEIGKEKNLDFYVDDRPEDIESMLKHKINCRKGIYIVDKPYNKSYHNKKVRRINKLSQIENLFN